MSSTEADQVDERSHQLLLDSEAGSTDLELPAFLAKPEGSPPYHGFPIVSESKTDGWYLGIITEYLDIHGCNEGDAYVIAPDGSRAGLVWDVGDGLITEICPPDKERWGVYQVWFNKPIRTTDDMVAAFREVLPPLQEIYVRLGSR